MIAIRDINTRRARVKTTKTAGAGPSSCLAGSLTAAQQDLVIRHLPLQLSVTDDQGTLVYWHGDLFADCEAGYIGRHVDDSHNEHSQQTIALMDEAFRQGSQDEALFRRIEDGRLILVRYCALRDADGAYRGMMETLQDITEIHTMEGKKLTLDW
jgi:DUF438 domain-containing protein